jgi:ankyrin repeat protein
LFHTDIFSAAWNGDLDLVKSFIKGDRRFSDAVDGTEYGNGWRPLHYACYQGNLQIVQELLNAGAKPNVTTGASVTDDPMFDADMNGAGGGEKAFQSPMGFTPLFYAAQRGHIDVCKELMSHNADPALFGYSPDSNTVFMCPFDHIVDYPQLASIFKHNKACALPSQLTSEVVGSTTLTSTGTLTVQLLGPKDPMSRPTVKGEVPLDYATVFGALPVSLWEIALVLVLGTKDDDKDDSLRVLVSVSGVNPNDMLQSGAGRSVAELKATVNKVWMGNLIRDSPQTVTMTIKGVNGMGSGQWSERLPVKMLYPRTSASAASSIAM